MTNKPSHDSHRSSVRFLRFEFSRNSMSSIHDFLFSILAFTFGSPSKTLIKLKFINTNFENFDFKVSNFYLDFSNLEHVSNYFKFQIIGIILTKFSIFRLRLS